MSCVSTCQETHARGIPPLGEALRGETEAAERIRDRQAAVVYLQAAERTGNVAEREQLRRRSAELLLRHWKLPGLWPYRGPRAS